LPVATGALPRERFSPMTRSGRLAHGPLAIQNNSGWL
jgi:hypothetical protein